MELKELGQVDEEGYEDGGEDEGGEVAKVGVVVQVDQVHPDRLLDGQEPLGGDAHHQVRLAAQQDCLCRVPQVGEQLDVQLVVEVEVGVEAVDDDHDDEEEVDDGEGDDGLVEVGVDGGASENNAGEKVSKNADRPNRGNAHLRRVLILNLKSELEMFKYLFCSAIEPKAPRQKLT